MLLAASEPPWVIAQIADGKKNVVKTCGVDYHAFHGHWPFTSPLCQDG